MGMGVEVFCEIMTLNNSEAEVQLYKFRTSKIFRPCKWEALL
jgi:hypothetical protein